MSNKYVVAFRSDLNRRPSAEQEQQWSAWFGQIGAHVHTFGDRVGRAVMLGEPADAGDQLSGYIIVTADDLDAAVQIASGCPGLAHGGRVEVGEAVPGPA